MVNLLKFRKKALYPAGSRNIAMIPMAANDRYSRAIVPLLFKHGGFPVFDSVVKAGSFQPECSGDDWDQCCMVTLPQPQGYDENGHRDRRKMAATSINGGVGEDTGLPSKDRWSTCVHQGGSLQLPFPDGIVLHLFLSGFKLY